MRNILILLIGLLIAVSCQKDYYLDDLNAAENQIDFLQNQRVIDGQTILDLEAQLDVANLTISDLEGVIAEANDDIAMLEADKEADANLIANLNDVIARAEAQILELQESNAAFLAALQEASARIQYLEDNPITVVEIVEVINEVEVIVTEYVTVTVQDDTAIDALTAELEFATAALSSSTESYRALWAYVKEVVADLEAAEGNLESITDAYRRLVDYVNSVATGKQRTTLLVDTIDDVTHTFTEIGSGTVEIEAGDDATVVVYNSVFTATRPGADGSTDSKDYTIAYENNEFVLYVDAEEPPFGTGFGYQDPTSLLDTYAALNDDIGIDASILSTETTFDIAEDQVLWVVVTNSPRRSYRAHRPGGSSSTTVRRPGF